jgi:hypothetical protein
MTAPKYEINVGSILQALILAALLWVGTSISKLNTQMADVQARVEDIADVKRRISAVEIEQARTASVQANNVARLNRLENSR